MGKRGNGEGSITRYKDGRWCARYTAHTANGPKRKAVYGKTRAEVAMKLAKAVTDRDGGLAYDAVNITVAEYLRGWLADAVRDTASGVLAASVPNDPALPGGLAPARRRGAQLSRGRPRGPRPSTAAPGT